MDVIIPQIGGNSTVSVSVNSRDELADPYRKRFLSNGVHAWMVTEWLQYVYINYSKRNIWGMTEETPNARIFYPHQYLWYKTHSSFTPIWMSVDIFCVPQMIFWTLMKTFWCWCWGSSVKTISLIATKHDHETWNKTTPIERLGIRLKANDLMMFLEEMSRVYVMNEVLV